MVPRQSDGMNAVTTNRSSPKGQGPWSPSQPRAKPSTTPGVPARTPSYTNHRRPDSATKGLSSHGRTPLGASSPNYFDFLSDPDNNPPNSNAGIHAKRNWSPPSGAGHTPNATSPANYPLEQQPRFENFRRESDTNVFRLSHGSLGRFSTSTGKRISPSNNSPTGSAGGSSSSPPKPLDQIPRADGQGEDTMEVDNIPDSLQQIPRQSFDSQAFFTDQRRDSPANDSNLDLSSLRRTQLTHVDEKHPRNSLPHNRADPALSNVAQRSETLPSSLQTDGPTIIPPDEAAGILKQYQPEDILLLDLRVYPQFSKSRIAGALNLCIPTTLLKRVSFNIHKLAETFTKPNERAKFDQWPSVKIIIVYDGSSNQLSDAISCVNILKKFAIESFQGATYVLRGGFNAFSKKFGDQIDKRPAAEMDGSNMKGLSINPPASAPIAGGCAMPTSRTAANPFFGTIRQNMDLIDGVGQIPVTLPATFKDKPKDLLPDWLRKVSNVDDKGRTASNTFLDIEKAEEQRMKKALSVNVEYDAPQVMSPNNFQMAGIEKGLKNRYKDILPYDHTRVRLQGVASGDCDYVNASHVQAYGSNKRYIASQAPVPTTFQDFWRVVWEQDARVIVMLTAETEGGNRKSHPYWLPDTYGSFKVKFLSERKVNLDRKEPQKPPRSFTSPLKPSPSESKPTRPPVSRRHSSKHSISSPSSSSPNTTTSSLASPVDSNHPHVAIRKIALSNTQAPFEPLREITQLHYSAWPDFGAPAHPTHVLGLVERCSDVVRSYEQQGSKSPFDDTSAEGQRPVVVHCSAGCGRTGTFCTVDSVIDMLKRQRSYRHQHPRERTESASSPGPVDTGVHDAMDVDLPSSDLQQQRQTSQQETPLGTDTPAGATWLQSDKVDLVQRTVTDFREQRLSMVQTLGQFVLCYESVLEWVAGELEAGGGKWEWGG